MPTYSYRCTQCGNAFDIQQKFTDDSLTECPSCQGALRKVFSAVGVTFNGSGFYRTDSRSGGTSGDGGSGSSGSESSGSGSSGSGTSDSSSGASGAGSSGSGSSGSGSSGSGSSTSSSSGSSGSSSSGV
ncbi:FmdB family transcriptional regulator [Rathayibacter tritici]|uniref:FmdB family transcriptional regulator n=1 Tax=Rathayibacter tritici TaxID=33888 RepID=A0A160KU26_9MICO|nr:FmdB family zinc ribbon protein [Rathayibacter tritici]AND17143.1 FmdB family transcriptional regulator [Rathayibacter tritici]PPF30649.1 FmdB family transcriptional regulator [Rathayibacter tritici]PPI14882.1 FmdB family transcriptional regulator [Rathayibacter tritici]PPI44541.1 FmdB family transcriptional regulator [Rathayibacter tritici]